MATKTISIELDVYEKLKAKKRHSRESFSQVLRRAKWEEKECTGLELLVWLEKRKTNNQILKEETLKKLDNAQKEDKAPENKWN